MADGCPNCGVDRDEILTVLKGLKIGSCWCECGIDNPMYGGMCSQRCHDARTLMKKLLSAPCSAPPTGEE